MESGAIASRSERIMASLIDGMIFMPLVLLDRSIGGLTQSQFIIFVYFLASWQLGWLYNTLLHGYRGQTLGKMHKKIQVVRFVDGSAIGYRRAGLRELPYVILVLVSTGVWIFTHVAWYGGWYSEAHDALVGKVYSAVFYSSLGWLLLEWLTMSLHPQRRAIHDLIAGTMVVRKNGMMETEKS